MIRTWIAAAAATAAGGALFLVSTSNPTTAGQREGPEAALPAKAAAPLKPAAAPLPIARAVLFSSGVGFFRREGDVEGNARVDLTFPVDNINDLIKSMTLEDLGGGQIAAISYDSRDPLEKTLKSFAINLTNSPGFSQILQQARGEKVEITLQPTTTGQPGALNGSLIGVEKQRVPAGNGPAVEVDVLNLWCADGIRAVKLSEVLRLRFLNPTMENEFRQALDTLALSHDTQKKAVSLNFAGQGKRRVRVGYVVESPIWKTSYRLVLDKDGGKPFLQGWAVVENPSDEDWKDVRVVLVSGRPISFQMDLYQPLYVPRPVIEPELFASLRPPTYTGAMESAGRYGNLGAMGGGGGGFGGPLRDAMGGSPPPAAKPGSAAGRRGVMLSDEQAPVANSTLRLAETTGGDVLREELTRQRMEIRQSVQSSASTAELGDYFQYVINQPVNLARQKSAMLPIINQEVDGQRLSIFNAAVHPKFPLHGLRFKNATDLHLMQGPITVFEGASYAGDARIADLQPKEERLLSYAVDLGVEVETQVPHTPSRFTTIKLNRGIAWVTSKHRQTRVYNAKNRAETERTLLVEHPFRADFQLVSEAKPAERARDVYRFEIKVPPGQTKSLEVREEQDHTIQYALTNTDDNTIGIWANSDASSPKVKEALHKAIDLKEKMAAARRSAEELQRDLKTITDDQQRLRSNLREMPQTAAAYKRYLEKFDKQETEIEKLQSDIKRQLEEVERQRKAYEAYLTALVLE